MQIIIASSRSGLIKTYQLTSNGDGGYDEVLQKTWKGHSLPVLDMAFDESGTYIATASNDRTVRVWNAEKGFCTHNFKGHKDIVLRVFFQPGTPLRVVSCGEGGELRAWDLDTKVSKVLDNHMSAALGVAFSESERKMMSGGRDKVISVWDMDTYELLKTIPVYEYIEAVACIPGREADVFITAGAKGNIKFWDADSIKQIHNFDIDAVAGTCVVSMLCVPYRGD